MTTNTNQTTELMTPEEVAEMLKISKAGVYRLINKRAIRFYKVMGSIRFKKSDIVSFLDANRFEVVGLHSYGNTKN